MLGRFLSQGDKTQDFIKLSVLTDLLSNSPRHTCMFHWHMEIQNTYFFVIFYFISKKWYKTFKSAFVSGYHGYKLHLIKIYMIDVLPLIQDSTLEIYVLLLFYCKRTEFLRLYIDILTSHTSCPWFGTFPYVELYKVTLHSYKIDEINLLSLRWYLTRHLFQY